MPRFSILVVAKDPGDKLKKTLESILAQHADVQVVVKDALSTDDSMEQAASALAALKAQGQLTLVSEKDAGIYDGMNRALELATGDYVQFLNCGDYYADEHVLADIDRCLTEAEQQSEAAPGADAPGPADATPETDGANAVAPATAPILLYGDVRERTSGQSAAAKPVMDDFACFRNIPCHQAMVYDRRLFATRGFNVAYKVRADYEHFFYCKYAAGAKLIYLPRILVDYEGGGFSETQKNRQRSAREHREITEMYLPKWKCRMYRLLMILSLQPLREKLAHWPATAALYARIKDMKYHAGR